MTAATLLVALAAGAATGLLISAVVTLTETKGGARRR